MVSQKQRFQSLIYTPFSRVMINYHDEAPPHQNIEIFISPLPENI